MMDNPSWMLLTPGLTEKKIADHLRSGKADQAFLDGIAFILDHPPHKKPRYRLKLVSGQAHRPRGATYDEAALVEDLRALEASSKTRGEKKRERMDVLEKHGVSERTARAATKTADEMDAIWAAVCNQISDAVNK